MEEFSTHKLLHADVIRTFSSPDGRERLVIFKRDDGTYGFDHEKWGDYPEEQCWIPWTNFASFCATEEIAVREGLSRMGWGEATYLPTTADDSPPNPSFEL